MPATRGRRAIPVTGPAAMPVALDVRCKKQGSSILHGIHGPFLTTGVAWAPLRPRECQGCPPVCSAFTVVPSRRTRPHGIAPPGVDGRLGGSDPDRHAK